MDDDYDGDEWYSDEEELAAERELAEDAEWKMIQKNTFTRWCNEHLKPAQRVSYSPKVHSIRNMSYMTSALFHLLFELRFIQSY